MHNSDPGDHPLSVVVDCVANPMCCCAIVVQAFKQWSLTEDNSSENVNIYWEVAPKNEVGPGIRAIWQEMTRDTGVDDCILER